MSKVISSNAGYHVLVDVIKAVRPDDTYQLKFTSQNDHTGESRVKFELVLSNSQLTTLSNLIVQKLTGYAEQTHV